MAPPPELIACQQCDLKHPEDTRACPFTGAPVREQPSWDDGPGRISSADLEPLCGQVLGDKYRVDKLSSMSVMAASYRGTHLSIGRQVSIETLSKHQAEDEKHAKRFVAAAQAAARLLHQNIVRVFDVGFLDDGTPFIVTEHLEGETLEALLAREGRLPPSEAVGLTLQLLDGISEAHRTGLVHRQIQPRNVFIASRSDPSGVKVMGFGLARAIDDDLSTSSGKNLGTPHYLAPEQALAYEDLDQRVDVWAVGALLYRMITGALPFDGENIAELAIQIVRDEPTPPSRFGALPDGLEPLILRALAKDRATRFADAGEMAAELSAFGLDDDTLADEAGFERALTEVDPPAGFEDAETTVDPRNAEDVQTLDDQPDVRAVLRRPRKP